MSNVIKMFDCPCEGSGWVCENHEFRPWSGIPLPQACYCRGAGMPCECNPTGELGNYISADMWAMN